ncbi:PLDc N-terminal domain-containing protein [Auraticoccus monumenti]|uniref:Phospholipase_D-nuclease N-terminal n=1 Tax=Auraticoccus monumenti TaxID=675864 RepID=A0A1G6WKT5_9ACTN|nr:PLDc N-terminal domain-containing protein [Auraticoccus monumenti]SDD66570.1 Phospholipase_D-nuclease N-terminal [Auraticoccus monumenti]
MVRYLPIFIALALMVYCIVDVAQTQGDVVRRAPRWLWLTVIVVVPIVGPICWLVLGRPTRNSGGSGGTTPPRYPDDDPDFLRRL